MEMTTPPNRSGFKKKPNRKLKKPPCRHKVTTLDLRILRLIFSNPKDKYNDWFLACVFLIIMATALHNYFEESDQISNEQAAV